MINQKSGRIYPIKKKNRYCNYIDGHPEVSLSELIYNFLQSFRNRKSRAKHCANEWHDPTPALSHSFTPRITWIGHATFLVQIGNINILTDPIFGHSSFLYPRILRPGLLPEQLPPIDFVLLSHNHMDHMDKPTLYALRNPGNTYFLVPDGDRRWFITRNFHPERVLEYSWWQNHTAREKESPVVFTFLPSLHWSQRTPFDRNRSLWGSWMISHEEHAIYFCGDSAYGSHFGTIAQEFRTSVALLPIGPCAPERTMAASHMNAIQALQAFTDLKATHLIPMHWGTFHFGTDSFADPILLLQKEWHRSMSTPGNTLLHIPRAGNPIAF